MTPMCEKFGKGLEEPKTSKNCMYILAEAKHNATF